MEKKSKKYTKERDELYGILSLIVAVDKRYCFFNPVLPENYSPDWICKNSKKGLEVTIDIPTIDFKKEKSSYKMLFNK